MITDRELYEQYLLGSKKAFEEMVIRHKNNIIYFITRYVKDIQIAEDISQDVFVYLLVKPEQYDFKYSLKTYLYMIAKCRAINYIKRESKISHMTETIDIPDSKELEDLVFSKNISENVRKTINKLKQSYQLIIYLVDFEGMSYNEVAQIMGKSLGQVKSTLYNARQQLKSFLEKEEMKYEG